jgi:hypothetical protein
MRNAMIGAVVIAAVSTLGDFIWAGWHLRHRVVYGLAHGAILFLCMGAYFGFLQRKTRIGAMYGAAIGAAAAASFYVLAPVAGYSVMFFVWAFVWMGLAFLVRRVLADPPLDGLLVRGIVAMIGSGVGFYVISGIWRPFNPEGWDYAIHLLSWTVAYLPGFIALLYSGQRQR